MPPIFHNGAGFHFHFSIHSFIHSFVIIHSLCFSCIFI